MSFQSVLKSGDEFLSEYRPPSTNSRLFNYLSQITCVAVIAGSKLIVNMVYDPQITGLEKLDAALARARRENRGLITIMNHMSVADDPFLWATLPWRYYKDVDDIRWGLGAANLCFSNKVLSTFFTLGKVLKTERFGRGPFQGSLDAAVRLLSPDDTLSLAFQPGQQNQSLKWYSPLWKILRTNQSSALSVEAKKLLGYGLQQDYVQPILRRKTSWVHIFPEGYVAQLEPPHSNSMRYFRWGTSRLILEPTVAPIVVPIFSQGFELIYPESSAEDGMDRFFPQNRGAHIRITVGDPVDDSVIAGFREKWNQLCHKYYDRESPGQMSEELKFGKEARALRANVSSFLRNLVSDLRTSTGLRAEDPRLKTHEFWHAYTHSKGVSSPDVKFIGKNWAIKEYQKNVKDYDEFGNEIS
ncbi:unnamed protein product [Kuraishia capsulata CBS 1993]|uniref:Tafazzin family protein n=1 Tax=Kuraishia capsulata CBS 1993 TaxID=1382522 RepID=W6MMU2_9ASCO|nr:uncharacterized protein KUCA_T00003486001 [Kuraishia capsulata CBS 1993]CDK27508.1 unnamed protein product [Kuraishia capsulata CBS 1993]